MKKIWILFLLSLTSLLHTGHALPVQSPLMEEPEIVINNIILAKVNEKTISLVDVVKQMDALIAQYYPEHANSNLARYQFFQRHWQETLQSMIDTQLILADAELMKLEVKDVDIREEIQTRFGPNVMKTLDKIGMTYDEVFAMVKSDLVSQKMTWFRASSKGLISVNPQKIKEAYQAYLVSNPMEEKWNYQVYTIRAKNGAKAELLAQHIRNLIEKKPETFDSIINKKEKTITVSLDALNNDPAQLTHLLSGEPLKAEVLQSPSAAELYEVTLSTNIFEASSKTVSDAHKKVLTGLHENEISAPIKQVSRLDNTPVYRVFRLKNHTQTLPSAFRALEGKLKNSLIQEAIAKENDTYLKKLRKRYGYEKSSNDYMPKNFTPFSLK